MFSFRILHLGVLFLMFIGLDVIQGQANTSSQSSAPVIILDHRDGSSIKEGKAKTFLKKEELHPAKSESLDDVNTSEKDFDLSGNNLNSQKAWLNTYQTKRNAFIVNDGKISASEKSALERIIIESKASINGSFACYYMQLREKRNQPESVQLLKQAISIDPNNALLSAETAWIAERIGDLSLRNKALNAYRSSGFISNVQLKFASWMLDAIPQNGLIITNGENDTYPVWLSNTSNKLVISLAMLEDVAWLNKTIAKWDASIHFKKSPSEQEFLNRIIKSNKPCYLAWSIRPDLLAPLSSQLFPIGPLLQVNDTNNDNVIRLRKFYFTEEVKAYLTSSEWKNDKYAVVLGNLIPGIQVLMQSPLVSDSQRSTLREMLANLSANSKNASGR